MRTLSLQIPKDQIACLIDPRSGHPIHVAILPFSALQQFEQGQANVRDANLSAKPHKNMVKTAKDNPSAFLHMNLGMHYLHAGLTTALEEDGMYAVQMNMINDSNHGFDNGNHTKAAVDTTCQNADEYRNANPEWQEPYVFAFLRDSASMPLPVPQIVNALNSSIGVKPMATSNHEGQYNTLKPIFAKPNLPTNLINWGRHKNQGVIAIDLAIARLFLLLEKGLLEPKVMLMRHQSAKRFFQPTNQAEILAMEPILVQAVMIDELIQHSLSSYGTRIDAILIGKNKTQVKSNILARVKKRSKASDVKAQAMLALFGDEFRSDYRFGMSAMFPMIAACRSLIQLDSASGKYSWRVPIKDAVQKLAPGFLDVFESRFRITKAGNRQTLGYDEVYWDRLEKVVMSIYPVNTNAAAA